MPKLINVPGVGRVPVPDDYSFEQILDLREQLQKKSGIEPDLTPQFGLGELLGRGFERGVERTKIAFGDVLPAMIGSGLGYEDFAKRQMEEAAVSEQALQERLPARYKSYEDIKGLGDIPGYAVETIGEAGPDILTSLFPGGAGAVAGRIGAQQAARQALAGAARQGLGREAAVKAAQEAAEKSATRGLLTGTYLGSYAQTAPEVFQNIYQETGEFNPTVAALYGGLSAALDSIVPAKVMNQLGTVGKGALIREMVKESGADPKVWQTIGKGVAKGFATEGLTETAQDFINNLAVKTLKENYDLFSPENVTRYIDSFLRGAIVGGGISLPSSTIEAVRERGLVKARQQEEAAKVAEGERVQAEQVAAQQKLDQENQILSQIPEGIEPIKVGEDIFTVEKTGAAGDLIPRGYIVSGVQDRQVDTLDEAESLKAAMESTREDDIKAQEEERTKLIEKLAKLDEQLDQKQKDVINVSKEDFEAFRDKTYPEQSGKLNEQIAIKDQILDRLNKPIEIKPLEEQVPREADEYTAFKRTPEGQQAISRHVSPEEAKERLFKPTQEPVAEPAVEPVEPVAEPELVGKGEVTGQPLEELRQELDRLGLPEVGVKLYDALLGQGTPVDGAFAQQTINIAMTPATRTRLQTLHHEAIHALKEAGLFTAGEWKALSTAAKKDWLKRKWPDLQGKTVADLYADQSPEIQIEEAIAVAFEHYMKKAFSPAGQVSSAFQKIANFFGRIKNFFTGKGYQTADDVFDFVASGAMRYKIRPSEVSIGPTKLAKAPPVESKEFKQWFKNSKVVNSLGKPRVVYHGTASDISIFDINRAGKTYGKPEERAFFFTGRLPTAESAADDATKLPMFQAKYTNQGFGGGMDRGDYYGGYDTDEGDYDLTASYLGGQNIIPVYLSLQNPLIIKAREGYGAGTYFENGPETPEELINRAKREGNDGVIIVGQYRNYEAINRINASNITERERKEALDKVARDDARKQQTDKYFIAFRSDQIKSAYGNIGAYGQRPVTAKEAERFGMGPSEAAYRQYEGDIRFARSEPVQSKEFKQWFGDSKVVDKAGKPQVMYTGTSKDKDFSFFKIPGNGAWFSSSPEDASMYAKENDSMGFKYDPDKRTYVPINTASRVLPVYLSIQNPAKLSKEDDEAMRYASNYKKVQTNIFSRLLSEGYDGVDMGGGTWVVLKSPDQIKSAIGNVGAYGQREVTQQEAEQVGLTPAQAKAAQKKGDIRFARSASVGVDGFKDQILAMLYYVDDLAAYSVANYIANMPIVTPDKGEQKLGNIISYSDSKTLSRRLKLLQTYEADKNQEKKEGMLKSIQNILFSYGTPKPFDDMHNDVLDSSSEFTKFVKSKKPASASDENLISQTYALYVATLTLSDAIYDSSINLPKLSPQKIKEEPTKPIPVTVTIGKKEPAFKKPQTILEERLAKYFPDVPEEHRKVFTDALGDFKIALHNGKVVTNNQLMDEKNIYGIGFTKLIDLYKDAYQDSDSTEMTSAATEAASQMYSYGNVDFREPYNTFVGKKAKFDVSIKDPKNLTEEEARLDKFYSMALEFLVELRTAYIQLSTKAPEPLTPTYTEVNQPAKVDFVDKVWSERNWREPWIIKTAKEMAEAFEQQRKEFKHLSVGTPEFNEFMRRTKEKRLMYHATTIRGDVGEGKAWTVFESWRNFICVTTSPWFAKDWRNTDNPGAFTYRLVVMTEKPVEFWNEQQVDEILANMPDSAFSAKPRSEFKKYVMNGEWVYIESENFVKTAQKLGYDAIYITERNALNMAVFSPTQVKSVIGEAGTYGIRPLTKDEAAKYGLTQAQALKEQKLGNVLFARSPLTDTSQFKNWFKDSKAVEKGEPKLMYHGTSRDITYFMPKQANAIFVTDSPKFAGAFASDSYQWMARHVDEWATPEMMKTAERYAEKLIRQDYQGRTRAEILGQLKRREGEGLDYLTRAYQDMVPIGPNIIPVYVSVQNPFDFENKDHREKISAALAKLNNVMVGSGIHMRDMRLLEQGSWIFIEEANTQKAIRDAGFDGFYVKEGGEKNLAVFDSSQLKSVFNYGTFSPDDRRISFARSPIADMQESALEKIDAVQSKAQDNGYNLAKSPTTAKQGMNVVNQFMSQSPSFGKKVVDRILDMGTNNRTLVYNFLTLEQMADVGKDLLPELTPYYETFQEMAGYRDKQLYYASKIGKRLYELGRKSPEQTELLADVAHSATIASFDPDRPVGKNQQITDMWNRLNPEAKQLYRDMRNFYDNRYKAYRALLQERIDSAITDKNKKAEINAKMRQMFETNKVTGPYFPLARFGQYWVSYNDGTERFVMFEKQAEAERFAQDLKAKGVKDVKAGLREEYNLNMPVPNSIIKELIDTVDKAGSPQELKRDLWMAYLTMLPEVSMRKHFIPRKGTPGYSNDIARVFAENTFHGAYNLARLKYAPQFERHIDAMRTRVSEANKKGEGNKPGELFNALLKRQNYIMNPTPSNMITDAAGILGFTWFLTAPASAITNLSQNATVAYPVLGARFGFGKAMNEMLAASRLFMSSGERNIDEPFSIVRALEQRVKESTGAEKKAFQRELEAMNALMDNGTLSRTQAMDLAQMADRPSIVGTKLNTTMKWVGAMFHGAEVFNRSTTAYAAYRMAFEKTGDQDAAIKEATRLVRRSHFDYSASNKPPILQNDFAKVIFMFKQYGINMTYLLLRESQILLKHVAAKYKGTPLEKEAIERAREARDTLIGTLGVTGLFSGVFGLPYPLYLMTMVIANALFGDEEDEIFDAETRFKLWLTDSLGADAADIIAKGPISYLSGADFSERVSANGLIFKDIGRLGPRQAEEQEQKDATMQWLVDVMGPIGGLAMNFSKGIGAMQNGNVYQGIEGMVPLPIANGLKAIRYASEGVLTMKGDPIVEEINGYQTFLRAIGYAPTEIARQLEENTAIRAVESQATLSRKQLLNRFALAIHTGDMDALEDIEAAIERFNDKYEGYEITGETLSQSLKARDAARAEVENGLRINKRIRDVYERGSRLND